MLSQGAGCCGCRVVPVQVRGPHGFTMFALRPPMVPVQSGGPRSFAGYTLCPPPWFHGTNRLACAAAALLISVLEHFGFRLPFMALCFNCHMPNLYWADLLWSPLICHLPLQPAPSLLLFVYTVCDADFAFRVVPGIGAAESSAMVLCIHLVPMSCLP